MLRRATGAVPAAARQAGGQPVPPRAVGPVEAPEVPGQIADRTTTASDTAAYQAFLRSTPEAGRTG